MATSFYKIAVCILAANFIVCKGRNKRIESLPSFRKQVEEISQEISGDPDDDSSQNLVSLLVNNAKQIFTDTEEPTIIFEPDLSTKNYKNIEESTIYPSSTHNSTVNEYNSIATNRNDIQDVNSTINVKNEDVENLVYVKSITDSSQKEDISKRQLNLSGDVLIQESQHESKDSRKSRTRSSIILNMTLPEKDNSLPRRSCIECNNILSKECNNPKNKL